MKPNIKPQEPLSHVVFVRDYLQLVFQDDTFSIYNVAKIQINGKTFVVGAVGFCDALVSLIGQRITEATDTNESALSLSFEGGALFMVMSGDNYARGPEAFQYDGPNDLKVVGQNA